jgi:hypothetical protein
VIGVGCGERPNLPHVAYVLHLHTHTQTCI